MDVEGEEAEGLAGTWWGSLPSFLCRAGLGPVGDGELSSQHTDVPDFPVWLLVCRLQPDTQSPTQSNCLHLPTHC